jgi:phosphatidylserine/phosphatidylglycerophosphate/cardiolipin synthase-like enzyme
VSIGSANLDNRSFALNNELNLVFMDPGIASRLIQVFHEDLGFSRPVSDGDLEQGVNRFFYLPLLPLRDQL